VTSDPVNWIDPNGLNPVAGASIGGTVAGPPGAFVGAAIGIGIGVVIGDKMFSKENRPPGAIDAIAGSKEWGKRNGVGGRKAVDIFHDIKKGNRGMPGSKAGDDCSVNPDTGDVYDGQGEHIGNLGEGH
jgi:hypothetical protein